MDIMDIKDAEIHAMVKELAMLTGCELTDAIRMAVQQALIQARDKHSTVRSLTLGQRLTEISLRCAALPDCDPRGMDEVLGYDEFGLPC
ncbi:MAG: type II toxin-antitoxin system VapB family antitoxin [Nodosilinea sp.]